MRGTEHRQHMEGDPEELLHGCVWKLPGAVVIQHSEGTAEHRKTGKMGGRMEEH